MYKLVIFLLFNILTGLNSVIFTGSASWYGPDFHGKKTANGEIFNTNDFTAAHKTLPFGSIVKVTSLENNKSTIARINDRGPFAKNRIIDLSKACALELGMIEKGTMDIKIELLEKGDNKYHKYSKKKYTVQVASFSDKEKADEMFDELMLKGFNVVIKKVVIEYKYYYRLIIDNLNYYELQEYRIKFYKMGLDNYIILFG